MLTKIRFKLELYLFYLKKNLPFIILGLIAGALIITYQTQLISFYRKFTTPATKLELRGYIPPPTCLRYFQQNFLWTDRNQRKRQGRHLTHCQRIKC